MGSFADYYVFRADRAAAHALQERARHAKDLRSREPVPLTNILKIASILSRCVYTIAITRVVFRLCSSIA